MDLNGLNLGALLGPGGVSPAQLERALRAVAREGGPLVRHLCEAAAISDEDLCDVIARAADLPRCAPADLAAVDVEALALVPAELCRLCCAMPIRVDAWDALVVAMADPFDEGARAELEFAAGRQLRVELATERTVREAITRLHGDGEAGSDPAALPQYFFDEDDLHELFAAAAADEADIIEAIEIGEVVMTADEPPRRRAAG